MSLKSVNADNRLILKTLSSARSVVGRYPENAEFLYFKHGHSGKGWYVGCHNFFEEGSIFLGEDPSFVLLLETIFNEEERALNGD